MNYLGLDYGEKHIGVAIATGPLAEPLTTIPNSSAYLSLKSLVQKQAITALVVGVPDSGENPSLKQFIHQLSSLHLPVFLADETLSTKDAVAALRHTTQSRRKDLEHAASAAIILQSWLDSRLPKPQT